MKLSATHAFNCIVLMVKFGRTSCEDIPSALIYINYATKKHKPIFDSCFCLEVTIFLKSLKQSMANWKSCTLETKTLIRKLKVLICRLTK